MSDNRRIKRLDEEICEKREEIVLIEKKNKVGRSQTKKEELTEVELEEGRRNR